MRYQLFIIVIALFATFTAESSGQAILMAPTDDTQMWNDLQLTVPLKKRVDLVFKGSFRLGRNLSHPVGERAGVYLAFKANRFLTFETGYLYSASQPSEGRKGYNSTLSFGGTVRSNISKLAITNRSQVERRIRNSRPDNTRFRHRLRVEYPVVIRETKFNVFASDEVFYEGGINRWTRNRFAIGVNKKLSPRFTKEIYYMRQNDRFSRPGDLHIIGTLLKIQL